MVFYYVALTAVILGTVAVGTLVMIRQAKRAVAKHDAELQALRPTPIGKLVEGARVRVIGTANGSELVAAPYSGTKCLAFEGNQSATVSDGQDRRTFADRTAGTSGRSASTTAPARSRSRSST